MNRLYTIILALIVINISSAQEAQLWTALIDDSVLASNGLYFDGVQGVNFQYSPRISPHGDCIDVVNGYVFVTWYKGGINNRNLMLSRKNLNVAGSNWVTIEFPHQHVGFQGINPTIGDSHNTAAIGVSTINETIHLIYDLHAYRESNLPNDFFNYSVSSPNAAFVPDAQFNLSLFNPKQNYLKLGQDYDRMTYPMLHRADDGSLIARYRKGGSGNGDIFMSHYNGITWSNNWLFHEGTLPLPNRNNMYGGERFLNGKFYAGFSIRYSTNNSANTSNGFLLNSGLYYAYTNQIPTNQSSQWFDVNDNAISIPIINNINPNLDPVQIGQPGDDYGTSSLPRTSSDPSWTVTQNGAIHFITRVDNINVHYYKGATDTNFSSNAGGLIPNPDVRGEIYSYNDQVFMVELISGKVNIKSTPEGTNDWEIVYTGTSATNFMHFDAFVTGDKLYVYLMEDTSGDARPLHLKVFSLSTSTITSVSDGDWNVGATWDTGTVPTATDNVVIDDHGITVPVSYAAECTDLTIQGSTNGRFIEVEEGASLNVSGDLITNRSQDGVRLSYSTSIPTNKDLGTIIIDGITRSDAITPNNRRALISKQLPTSDDWHLISVGGTISRQNELARTATTDHNYNIVTNGAGTLFSVGAYNGANAAGSKYEYIPVATYANSVSFDKIGYAVKVENTVTAARSNIRLRPVIEDKDASEDVSDAGDGFNLVGNPYLSYIHANTAAHATDNLLTVNSAVLEEQTIWMWNNTTAGGSGWTTFNLGDAALRMHPTQGFFVKAKSGGDVTESFSYTKAMQSHSKAGEYLRTVNNRFEIILSIANSELSRSTSIRYIDNTSTSFDNGYDSSMFGGFASELEVYTGLVDDNSGKKLAIQSLPNVNYADMVIPLGVTAVPNSEITFTAQALNVPLGYEVYLEDRPNNSFTRMDEAGSEYTTTVTETSTEGRFYLHTTNSALSTVSELLNSVSIYKYNLSTLRIVGLPNGKTNFKLYDLLGKQLLNSKFIANSGVKELSLPNLSKGVYVVQLETENGKLNRKIIL